MGLFKKKVKGTENLAIDLSENLIILAFLEKVSKKEIKNYVLFEDAVCYNFTVEGIYTNYGTEIYYKERGYQELDKNMIKVINTQLLKDITAIQGVKEVKKIPWVVNYTRYKYDSAYGRKIPYKTLKGEFYEIIYGEKMLKSW